METDNKTPILNVAWTRYAHFDAASNRRQKANDRLRWWVAILGILATLFAILTQMLPKDSPEILGLILKIFFIATPIISSALAAFVNEFFGGGDFLVLRAGAEQILKEIYTYRTLLQKSPERKKWLESRLGDIQRQIYSGLGGEMVIKPYNGPIPPYDSPSDPTDDSGFDDLTGDQYFTFRVENQLAWHMKKVNHFETERIQLRVFILAAGVAGAFFAAWGGPLGLWVALTASIVSAMVGWKELRNLDARLKNYSKVVLDLMVIYDHWNNLDPKQRTNKEFYAMVHNTEELLWAQNVEFIKAMQEALAKNKEDQSLIDGVLQKSIDEDANFKESIKDTVIDGSEKALHETNDALAETYKKTFGSLAEEASSPVVQAELAAMQKAAAQAAEAVIEGTSRFTSSLQSIAAEFAGTPINGDTPVNVLNDLISRYPTTKEPKG